MPKLTRLQLLEAERDRLHCKMLANVDSKDFFTAASEHRIILIKIAKEKQTDKSQYTPERQYQNEYSLPSNFFSNPQIK